MAVSFGTYYINAESFAAATSIFTDADMTITAPDGVYQFSGIYRAMSSGVLGSPITCPTCCVVCSGTAVYVIPNTKDQTHRVCSDVGKFPNTAIIVKFTFSGAPLGYPLGLEAIFDSNTYTGVISNRYGWLPNKYVGNNNAVIPSVMVGGSPYTLNIWDWIPLTSQWQSTLSTVSETIALSDINVNPQNNPDQCYMVIPKLTTSPTIETRVYSPKPTGTAGGGADVIVNCPAALRSFSTSLPKVDAASACSAEAGLLAYQVQVNGAGGAPRLYDKIFSTPSASIVVPNGYYYITNTGGSPSAGGWMKVDIDGIVQATGTCASGLYPAMTRAISSQMITTEPSVCAIGLATPSENYWHDGSNDAPVAGDVMYSDPLQATTLLDGWYQLLRQYAKVHITGGLGVVNTVSYCT